MEAKKESKRTEEKTKQQHRGVGDKKEAKAMRWATKTHKDEDMRVLVRR